MGVWLSSTGLAGARCATVMCCVAELNASQQAAWRRTIDGLADGLVKTFAADPKEIKHLRLCYMANPLSRVNSGEAAGSWVNRVFPNPNRSPVI